MGCRFIHRKRFNKGLIKGLTTVSAILALFLGVFFVVAYVLPASAQIEPQAANASVEVLPNMTFCSATNTYQVVIKHLSGDPIEEVRIHNASYQGRHNNLPPHDSFECGPAPAGWALAVNSTPGLPFCQYNALLPVDRLTVGNTKNFTFKAHTTTQSNYQWGVETRDINFNWQIHAPKITVDCTAPTTYKDFVGPNKTLITEYGVVEWIDGVTKVKLTAVDDREHNSSVNATYWKNFMAPDYFCQYPEVHCKPQNFIYYTTSSEGSGHVTVSTADPKILTKNGGSTVYTFSPTLGPGQANQSIDYYYGINAISTEAKADVRWRIKITADVGGLVPGDVELEEVGWYDPVECSIKSPPGGCPNLGSEPYVFASDGSGGLVALGSSGWGIAAESFNNVDRIHFKSSAPAGTYTIRRELLDTITGLPISNAYIQTIVVGWNLYTGPFQKNEESCHVLEFYSIDNMNNTEPVRANCFFVDKTPPVVNKINGQPQIDRGNGTLLVTPATPITFTCTDQQPHPSGDEELCFRVSYDVPSYPTYLTRGYCNKYGGSLQSIYGADWCCVDATPQVPFIFNFNKNEDSLHDLEYFCRDAVNKTSQTHIQFYEVDAAPPNITKTIHGPQSGQCPPTNETCWIQDHVTSIIVDAKDNAGRHDTGRVSCSWFVEGPDQKSGEGVPPFNITIKKDSTHVLNVTCIDGLGNIASDKETFLVDSIPPDTRKAYGTPLFSNASGTWISNKTKVTLNASDNKVGVNKTYWRNTLLESNAPCFSNSVCQQTVGTGAWNVYTGPFKKPEDSCHLIEYYSVDKLGNNESSPINEITGERTEVGPKKQCVFVDNTPPDLTKVVGQPNATICEEGDETFEVDVLYGAAGGAVKGGEGDSSLYKIDPATGSATLVGLITNGTRNFSVSGLAFSSGGTLYGAGKDAFISINPATGAAIFIGEISFANGYLAGNTCADISFAPNGTLYCYNEAGDGWAITNPATGAATFVGYTGTPSCCGNGMDVKANGTVYHGHEGGLNVINPSTGVATFISAWGFPAGVKCIGAFCRPAAFDFNSAGTLYATLFNESGPSGDAFLVTIDTELVSMSLVGKTTDNMDAIAFRKENITRGRCDDYISPQTPINLTCKDPEPHPVDHEVLYWRNYLSNESVPAYTKDTDGKAIIYKPEDSRHILEAYCEDALGNAGPVDREEFVVDARPPVITKQVIGPQSGQCPPANETCWIQDHVTSIIVDARDSEPHPVGGVKCDWEVSGPDAKSAFGVTPPFNVTIKKDSTHTLTVSCYDKFYNTKTDKQTFNVDSIPPETTKAYSKPHVSNSTGEWISTKTNVTLSASDSKVGVDKTYWRNSLVNDTYCDGLDRKENDTLDCNNATGSGPWNVYTGPFQKPEESCHLIEYYSVDKLGNNESSPINQSSGQLINKGPKRQCVFVDNSAPLPNKTVGLPKETWDGRDARFYNISGRCWSNSSDSIDCWKVTLFTPVKMSCVDQQPHPVDHDTLFFKLDLDGKDATERYCDEYGGYYNASGDGFCEMSPDDDDGRPFYFLEESEHNLKFYCVDALGNKGPEDEEKFKVEGTPFNIHLFPKWNLISVPFVLFNDDIEAVFNESRDNISIVFAYDGVTGWSVWTPGPAPDTLNSIQPGWGYWVLALNDTDIMLAGSLFSPTVTPPSRDLVEGWNLIGPYGTEWQDFGNDPYCPYAVRPDTAPFEGSVFADYAYCALNTLVGTDGNILWDSLWTYVNCPGHPAGSPAWKGINACTTTPKDANKMVMGYGYWLDMKGPDMYAPASVCKSSTSCVYFTPS